MSKLLILDGGMSRELLRLGAELKQPEWSALALVNSPEIVRQVHDEFITAGSDVITTNSYALVSFHIGEERFWKVAKTGKPFRISFTLADDATQRNGAASKLRSGETVKDAARWAASSGAEALLFNCSKPEVMREAVDVAADVFKWDSSNLQIGVYANAFEGEQGELAANEGLHATREDLNDDAYSRFACSWVDAGATMVGGCCGIGAGHIH